MAKRRTSRDYDPQEIDNLEHDPDLHLKKVMPYGWDGSNAVAIKTGPSGETVVDVGTLNQTIDTHNESLGTTAKKIAFATADITIPTGAKTITIQNGHASNTLYIGASDVANDGSVCGVALHNKGDSYTFNNIGSSFVVYIIASAASTTTNIMYS